jgi:hypothetical protein
MYKVIYKNKETWFEQPIQATEVFPAKGWKVIEFPTYEEASDFIANLK